MIQQDLGVVLTGQNTSATIGLMLATLDAQCVRPKVVAFVDDGSTDGTAAVVNDWWSQSAIKRAGGVLLMERLRRGKHAPRICWPSKRLGFELLARSECRYGCALDTDGDYIASNYLAELRDALQRHPEAAVAYPRLRQFGARDGELPAAGDLARTNMAPATSMVRLGALEQVGGWPQPYPTYAFCDWSAWRRLKAAGWQLVPGQTTYYWRRHERSVSFTSPLHDVQWAATIDWTDLITIAVPLSGREWCLGKFLGSLAGQSVPQHLLRLVILDNSRSEKIRAAVMDWLADQRYGMAHYVADPVPAIAEQDNAAVADGPRELVAGAVTRRVQAVWRRLAQEIRTDLVWCLEDDIIPPAGALARLLARFQVNTDAVSAHYQDRRTKQPVAWHYGSSGQPVPSVRDVGLAPIDGCGFGCVLLRRHLLQDAGAWRQPAGADWYDSLFWRHWQGRARVLIDWELPVEHLQSPPCDKRKSKRGAVDE